MLNRITVLILILTLTVFASAQQSPADGAKLNYTQIMFDHTKVHGADQYVVQVDLAQADNTFDRPIAEHTDSSTATVLGGFGFGKKYVWRYAGISNGKKLEWNGPFTFDIMWDGYVDSNAYRLVITQHDEGITKGLVTLDEIRTIANRDGNFVWFLPQDESTNTPEGEINDLRVTSRGTLTFLKGRRAVETDLNGNTLWMAPKDTAEPLQIPNSIPQPYNYHHCFKRLASGNYMVQTKVNIPVSPALSGIIPGSEAATGQRPAGSPMSIPTQSPTASAVGPQNVLQYDIIKEFDKKGDVVWSWSSKDYFTQDEVKVMLASRPDGGVLAREPGGHLNAFYFDEKNRNVYAGFRNVSRVVKIDYKTGKPLHSWGSSILPGGSDDGAGFFSKQHDVSLFKDGSIAVFSNGTAPLPNSGISPLPSAVVLFSQPTDGSPSKIVWKFDCVFDSTIQHSTRGGNITELNNGNLLVCMGTINRIFEITRDKQILWQARVMKFNRAISLWTAKSLYKANFTSSLYPCYFTIQTNVDTVTKDKSSFNLKIFNDGSEDDSYIVRVSAAHGSYQTHLTSATVHSGRSQNISVAPAKVPKADGKISVEVTSAANPDFKRTAVIQFLK